MFISLPPSFLELVASEFYSEKVGRLMNEFFIVKKSFRLEDLVRFFINFDMAIGVQEEIWDFDDLCRKFGFLVSCEIFVYVHDYNLYLS